MQEGDARDVTLVQAIETADSARAMLSEDDRRQASRSARELARWDAASHRSDDTFDGFLAQRSRLLLERLAQTHRGVAALRRSALPITMVGAVLPVVALLAGFGLDRITDPHRVDLLSAPLLLILGWNLLVYAALPLVWWWSRRLVRRPLLPGWLHARRRRAPRKWPRPLAEASADFLARWSRMAAPLSMARMSRALHLSAAAFAFGAVASLYARGVLSQYQAGWESTFLDGRQVHALLAMLFAPATAVFPLQGFSLAEVQALHFGPSTAPAQYGARWVHLYAADILLLVVLPRLLLAAIAQVQARKRVRRFPIDLRTPYFRQLATAAGAPAGSLRVLPYSLRVDEARNKGLHVLAVSLLGDAAQVLLRPALAYGDDPAGSLRDTPLDDPQVAMTAVVFGLAATPERETHGELLDYLREHMRRPWTVLVDVSGFLERLGPSDSGTQRRLAQRVGLWEQFCAFHDAPVHIVDLLKPETRPIDPNRTVTHA
ncbi:MAG: DUF2868 domain-containing protein [Burkholderiaceae bacterium]